jgi:solute:Na+ symporter, SSS family
LLVLGASKDIRLDTNLADYAILAIYFVAVLGIGFAAKRYIKTSLDYFLSGRSLPAWITGLAFISANLGALEILGMAANGAQYGVYTVHYYWIGAVPAMVFLGIVMMPFYYGSKVRSVPEYLRLRFNKQTHLFNALTFAFATVLIAGVNLYALALVLKLMLGWPILFGIVVAAVVVLAYITLGGLSSAIYNEVLQFFVILAALIPLTIVGLHDVGGWDGLQDRVQKVNSKDELFHSWVGTGIGNVDNPLGASWVPIVFGLGFVLSFGYWTTNFAEVQRALSAKSLSAARRTPLIGAYPKAIIPAITIIPGLVALATIPGLGGKDPNLEFNNAIPLLMNEYLPNGMLGVALAGLLAAFMAGVAANVSAFNTVVTYDLWEPYVRSGQSDDYYLRFGRIATVTGIVIGIGTALIASGYNNIMDYIQLLQRAVVRHVHHRHVLEADDAVGGLLRAHRGHRGRGRGALWGQLGRDQPRVAAGGRVLGRDRGLRRRRRRLGHRLDVHAAQAGRRAAGPRPRHGQRSRGALRGGAGLVSQAVHAGDRRARHRPRPEHHLLVGDRNG